MNEAHAIVKPVGCVADAGRRCLPQTIEHLTDQLRILLGAISASCVPDQNLFHDASLGA
jgi:hypothetical protein